MDLFLDSILLHLLFCVVLHQYHTTALFSFPITAFRNYHKFSSLTQCKFIISQSRRSKSDMDLSRLNPRCQQGCILSWRLGENPFPALCICLQDSVLCIYRTEVLFPCWLAAEGCSQLPEAAAFLDSWSYTSVFKASNFRASPCLSSISSPFSVLYF